MSNSKIIATIVLIIAGLQLTLATAHETDNGVLRQPLLKEVLSGIPDHSVVAMTVQLDPGNVSPKHLHEAFVFVYVLSGKIRSQIGSETPVDYKVGDSWVERPGDVHTLTQNLSETETAKLLAVFVTKNGAKLRAAVTE